MTLGAEEFIRRFLLHVIPKGFMRVRHYGFLANHCKDCSVEVSSTHRPHARTASISPTLHRGVDAGLDRHRYPSLPALPERNSGVGFRTGGVPAVGFIVRTDLSINATVFPLLCARANAELCPVVSFCLLLAHAQWYLAVYLPKPISVNTLDHPTIPRSKWSDRLDVAVPIPIGNAFCLSQRFSPTGFNPNASDLHCYHRSFCARIRVKTYTFSSIVGLTPGITRRDERLKCGRLAHEGTLFAVGCMPLLVAA